jgi:transcriptional regulator with XRE-family HTH domain
MSASHSSRIPANGSAASPNRWWYWQGQSYDPVVAQRASALGDYLRARRERLRPEDVGLAASKRRRVAGLRREELATLAGISSAYYLRLEQGRVTNPSAQVLDALARALQLDAKATQHLHDLTAQPGGETSPTEAAAHAFADVIDQFLMPAILVNRYRDVLAANPLARALSPEFTPGQNLLRWRLLNPAAREFYVNWDEATEVLVNGLREFSGHCPLDPRMRALIAELSDASPRFRELWGRADVGDRLGIHHLRHPQVGDLYLYRHRLDAPYAGGDHVLMYRAEPGSDSARALEELRAMAETHSTPALG